MPNSSVPLQVLTAASANHYNHVRCMLSTLAATEPGIPVIVFALDATVASSLRRKQLKAANRRVQVKVVNWQSMPRFAQLQPKHKDASARGGFYAWKPLLIARQAAKACRASGRRQAAKAFRSMGEGVRGRAPRAAPPRRRSVRVRAPRVAKCAARWPRAPPRPPGAR